jgi:hypothetical protein
MKNTKTVTKTVNKKTTKKGVILKAKKSVHETDYGRQVLAPNHDLKKAVQTIGGARAILLNLHTEKLIKLESYQITILKASKKSQLVYETLKKLTYHHPKSGNPSPFYLLQCLYNKDKRSQLETAISRG